MDGYPDTARELGAWLATLARANPDIRQLHIDFCLKLISLGLPIWRSTLGLELLHPQQGGAQFVWTAEGSAVLEAQRANITATPDYLNSPVRVVDETGQYFRRRLEAPIAEMPLLEELRRSGATDYVIFPLPFLDTSRTETISFATKGEGGFGHEHIAALEWAGVMLSPYAERYVLRRISIDLLDTYVGRRSGERVYNGAIERGTAELIEAAVLMTDLRGFTRFSDAQPINAVLGVLNDFFEEVTFTIEQSGGEVLKFIGDGLLAIFPAQDGKLAPSCRAALLAAQDAIARLESLNSDSSSASRTLLPSGFALHSGEIAYGNIGGLLRLDFTAIGPTINHTSRLLELAKRLQVTAAVSKAFADECGVALPCLGLHTLRDVDVQQPVYTLTSPS